MKYVLAFDQPGKVDLADLTTAPPHGTSHDEAHELTAKLYERLFELQALLYGAATHSLLVVLQGMDAAGKDGAIRKIHAGLNPQGTQVVSFKIPTPREAAQDYLWRVHQQTPAKGTVAIFNRSHYEEVGVVRVHDLVPKAEWKSRYDDINAFESMLARQNTIVAKFWLHISLDQQKQRLLEREEDPTKAWKLNPGDWEERKLWDKYQEAYSDAIGHCSQPQAPWYVVPADAKWYRDLCLAHTLVTLLEPFQDDWQAALDKVGATQKAALASWRKEHPGEDG